MLALTPFLLAAAAWAVPADRAGDAVLQALADESPRTAVRLLTDTLKTEDNADAQADLGCLLGHAQRAAGDLTGAVATWERVPMEAGCGLRAGFDRADALAELGDHTQAAQLYDTYGWTRLGPGRDGLAWAQVQHLLDTLASRATPSAPRTEEMGALWSHALTLDLPETTRLDVALGAAQQAVDNDAYASDAVEALVDLLAEGAIPDNRRPEAARLAALLSTPQDGLLLIDAYDDGSIAHAASRARIVARVDPAAGVLALSQVVARVPDDADLRRELALALDGELRIGESREHWLALTEGPHAPEAGLRLARIARQLHQDPVRAAAASQHWLQRWLDAHPLHADRAAVELELAGLQLAEARALHTAGRSAEAVSRYVALLEIDPPGLNRAELEWETGAAELASGDRNAAMARWERMLAQGSWTDRAIASLVSAKAEDDPVAAMGWLEARANQSGPLQSTAQQELNRRSQTALHLSSGQHDDDDLIAALSASDGSRMRAHVRNVDKLTLRLHHIDAEAMLRAGGQAASLARLDVAVIAPDREWTVDLGPGAPGIDRAIELPLDLPRPGVYAVTADTGTHQAQVIVRRGTGSVLTRAAEGQLVIAALREGRPEAGARVLVALHDKVHEARTDRSGIAKVGVERAGTAQVLVLGRGGPTFVQARVQPHNGHSQLTFEADLSQPVALPGSRLAFRLTGRQDGGPIEGSWRLWLQSGIAPGPALLVSASSLGTLHGDLPVPTTLRTNGPLNLMAERVDRPGTATVASTISVMDSRETDARIIILDDQSPARARVVDGAGVPLGDRVVELDLGDGTVRSQLTDATGELSLPTTMPGLRPRWRVRTPGGIWHTSRRSWTEAPRPTTIDTTHPSPTVGGSTTLTISGEPGPARLVWSQVVAVEAAEPPAPIPCLGCSDTPDRFQGPLAWPDTEAGEVVLLPWSQAPRPHEATGSVPRLPESVEIPDSGTVELQVSNLPEGRWRVQVVPADPFARTQALDLHVGAPGPGPLAARWQSGGSFAVRAESPSLLTVESDGIVSAAVVGPQGARLTLPHARAARLTLVDAAGHRHLTTRTLDSALEVGLEVDATPDRWRIDLSLRDPAGQPISGQIALRAVDQRLHNDLGRLRVGQLSADASRLLLREGPGAGTTAFGAGFLMHRAGKPLSQALLAEAARQEAAERARRASRGDLEGGAGQLLMEETFMGEMSISGVGTGGGGGGRSGWGSGGGTFGRSSGGARAGSRPLPGPSTRDSAIWAVVDVDRNGRGSVSLPAPPPGEWRIEAHGVSSQAAGTVSTTLDTDLLPRLAVPELGPTAPGTHTTVIVHAVNPTDTAKALELDGAPIRLAPHSAHPVALAERVAGSTTSLKLTSAGELVAQASVALPVSAPGVPSAEGALVRVAVGAGGGLPLRLWLDEALADAGQSPGGIARAGRLALAVATRSRDAELRRYAMEQAGVRLQEVRTAARPTSALDAADVVAFLGEARAAWVAGAGLPPLTTGDLEDGVKQAIQSVNQQDSRDRVALQWALAVAGQAADDTTLSRLERDAERLDEDTRSWLARALLARDRTDRASGLIAGNGPHAVLARHALGQAATPPTLPSPGHPQRVHAQLAHLAVAPSPGRLPDTVSVLVDGRPQAQLDVQQGGHLTLTVPPGAAVAIEGDVGAVIERGDLHGGLAPFKASLHPSVGGRPVAVSRQLKPHILDCGGPDAACALLAGDALSMSGVRWRAGATCSAGLACSGATITGVHTGLQVVHGLQLQQDGAWTDAAPVWIEVHTEADRRPDLPPESALRLAQAEEDLGLDPLPALSAWDTFDAWPAALRPAAMALRWRASNGSDAAGRVAAFENLRDADPGAALTLEEVASVARAYAELGHAERAVDIWRAGLGAAFLVEVGPLRKLEELVGPLPALKALVELPQRYPSLGTVEEAEFHLPGQLARIIDMGLPTDLREAGVTEVDIQLLAAAWHRRFLAFHPRSELAPQAGLQLAKALLDLDAPAAAARQARISASRAPDDPVLDALVFLESLALSRDGQAAEARRLLRRLADSADWPTPGGGRGPARLRPDARYALARLDEAAGRYEEAAEGYAEISEQFSELKEAREALVRVSLDSPPIVTSTHGQPGRTPIPLTSVNVDQVYIRAYALDLRTVYLRDGGLQSVSKLWVDGVSPTWSGRMRLGTGPHPDTVDFHLPVNGSGAWLVQVDADGARTETLLVRSHLQLDVLDQPGGRRISVRRGNAAAAQVEIRAITQPGAPVLATRTDERGVAVLPWGASALVFDGDDVAFTPLDLAPVSKLRQIHGEPADPMKRLDFRLRKERQKQNSRYEQTYQLEADESLDADLL